MPEDFQILAERPALSLVKRTLTLTFRVSDASLGASATQDVLVLTGHRCRATIVNEGMRGGMTAELYVEGMKARDMARLSMVSGWLTPAHATAKGLSAATLQIDASDEHTPPATVFFGQLLEGYNDLSNAPQTGFSVRAGTNAAYEAHPAKPLSYKNSVRYTAVLADICAQAGLTLRNHGLEGGFAGGYYSSGETLKQIERLVSAAQGVFNIDQHKVLHVWGKAAAGQLTGSPITGGQTTGAPSSDDGPDKAPLPLLNPQSGLVSYPKFTAVGLQCRTLFRPDLDYWSPFTLESASLPTGWERAPEPPPASASSASSSDHAETTSSRLHPPPAHPAWNGAWLPKRLMHRLTAETPGGAWLTDIEAIRAESPLPHGY